MPVVTAPGMRPVHMGESSVEMTKSPEGVVYVRSSVPLGDHSRSMTDSLRRWASEAPDRVFLADRGPDGAWRKVTFSQALEKARAIAQFILDRGLSAERPIVVLSGNSVEHGLIALGAMMAGVPFAPVSPAYSLVSKDHAKLRHIFDLLTPGLVFAAEGKPFEAALKSVMTPDIGLVVARNPAEGFACETFEDMLATRPTDAVEKADAAVEPDAPAKFLFTSGSTGMPKAVINTQRMMTCNQVMIAAAMAFLKDEPPVLVDWLPWNHTAGGNHNFGIALTNGGTLWIDDGAPTPAGIEKTVRNLTEIAPTLYFNVPKGYEMLCEHLARNAALRERFFSRVQILQYAGASLSKHVWDTLERLATETVGERIMIITGYGSTETAPFAFTTTWPVGQPGEVGLPAPDIEVKLVENNGKLELRLKGPNITPGYWRQPDKTAECFDEEGFYKIGDALKFVDPTDRRKGLHLRRPRDRGLQAFDRHLGQHGRRAHRPDRRLCALCARRGADRARPQPHRRAALPRSRRGAAHRARTRGRRRGAFRRPPCRAADLPGTAGRACEKVDRQFQHGRARRHLRSAAVNRRA